MMIFLMVYEWDIENRQWGYVRLGWDIICCVDSEPLLQREIEKRLEAKTIGLV